MLSGKQIGLMGGLLILVGAGVYFGLNLVPNPIDSKEALLGDYQKMFQETEELIMNSGSAGFCDNKDKLSAQVQTWQNELAELKNRRRDLLELEGDDLSLDESESESPDLPGGDYSDVPAEEVLLESQDSGLPDGDYTDLPPTEALSDGDYSDMPTEEVLSEPQEVELLGGDYTDLPATEALGSGDRLPELSGGDYTNLSADAALSSVSESSELLNGDYSDVQEEALLESQELELPNGDYTELPANEALDDNSQPVELPGGDYSDVKSEEALGNVENEWIEITSLEQGIEESLNTLMAMLSLCENGNGEEIVSTSCDSACQKYRDCASYADDDTPEDLAEAYESCMEECAGWSDETVICINRKPIRAAVDCANLSQCVLEEYNDLLR